MAGVSLADIADLLGHKDLATTRIYAKVQQQHVRTVIGTLTGLVPAAVGFVSRATNRRRGRLTPEDHPNRQDRAQRGIGGLSGTISATGSSEPSNYGSRLFVPRSRTHTLRRYSSAAASIST